MTVKELVTIISKSVSIEFCKQHTNAYTKYENCRDKEATMIDVDDDNHGAIIYYQIEEEFNNEN